MRYILIGIILLSFIGCGSSSSSKESDNIVKPTSPKTKDSSKQPPSIPNI
jgi:hypothetical protein